MRIKVSKFESKIGRIYTIKVGRRLATNKDFGVEYGIACNNPVGFQTRKEALQYAKKLRKLI